MIAEFFDHLSDWGQLDTWICITSALASMACALPGNYLLLRRQSMVGDALSHIVLPGIVIAFLVSHSLKESGWISEGVYDATRHQVMFFGALAVGVLAAFLIEWVQNLGRVESSAALGVVFTTMFAVGLLLIRIAADSVHIDPDCVLYGTIETTVLDTFGQTPVPKAAIVNGTVLLCNLLLVVVFYKELQVSAFDSGLADSMGISPRAMHYGLMALTSATLVAAFESVGSILVIATLIVPAATAYLLTDRLHWMLVISLSVAACGAVLGHVMAITLPPIVFSRLGFPTVVDASTAGMTAVACGVLFFAAMFFGPRHGIISKLIQRTRLSLKIVREDVLGMLYRLDERAIAADTQTLTLRQPGLRSAMLRRLAIWQLRWRGNVVPAPRGYRLTDSGHRRAQNLVRSHRLWESYLAEHLALPQDHLHDSAHLVEHFIDPELRRELESELGEPAQDPHGRTIPAEEDGDQHQ